MQFLVLGHLEVEADGRAVALTGIQQRAVLGYLLLHANQVVSTSRLIEALWADQAPVTARRMVHNAVSGIRRVLSGECAATIIGTRHPGYLVRVEPGELDLLRFRRLVERGRSEFMGGSFE